MPRQSYYNLNLAPKVNELPYVTHQHAHLLSVVMPVFNAGPYLPIAIESILRQTFGAFDFIIYDDGSTDGSYEAALAYAECDCRIRVLRGKSRKGPVASSRAAATAATTPFVARMDADDVARLDRLELQLRAMLSVPEAAVIGSLYTFVDGSGALLRTSDRSQLLGGRPQLVHPSIMYRREIMEQAGGYHEGTDLMEDTDLVRRLSERGTMLILPQPLIEMRMAGQNARSRDDMLKIEASMNRYYQRRQTAGSSQGVEPEVYHTIALLCIYRGTRPRMFLRALARVRLRRFRAVAKALALLALASLSPVLARRCSYVWAVIGDRIASRTIARDHLYGWRADTLHDLGTSYRDTVIHQQHAQGTFCGS